MHKIFAARLKDKTLSENLSHETPASPLRKFLRQANYSTK